MQTCFNDAGLVIAGGGSGSRFGGDKLLMDLGGMPLFCVTLRQLAPLFPEGHCVMAVPADRIGVYEAVAARTVPAIRCRFVAGGATRSGSVQCGLAALPAACRYVAIHDAARPLADGALLQAVMHAAMRTGGAIPAMPVVDTLKQGGPDNRITATVDRTGLYAVSTPQCFALERLREAYRWSGGTAATDDAAIMEQAGFPVELVPWTRPNPKVTYAADLALAAFYLAAGNGSVEERTVSQPADGQFPVGKEAEGGGEAPLGQ